MALDDYDLTVDHSLDLADTIATLAQLGEPIPTHIPFLDKFFRKGGVYAGKLLCITGPPGSGKTTLATMLLNEMSPFMPGRALFVDEGREEAAVRLGQQLGYSQDDLENGAPGLLKFIKPRTENTYRLDDPDEVGACIVKSLDLLCQQRGNHASKARLIVVDSIQRVRWEVGQELPPGARESIETACYGLRDVCRARSLIGVMTAQAGRDQYKAKKESERADPLGAAKGSSAPEFASDFCITLGMANEEDIVPAYITKNRMGMKGKIYLKLDRVKAVLVEVDENAVDESAAREQLDMRQARVEKLYSQVTKELAKTPGLNSYQLRQAITGRPEDLKIALQQLEEKAQIVATRTGPRKTLVYDLVK